MSATGLDVFDKTLQTTNTWLDEIMESLGPDCQIACSVQLRSSWTMACRLWRGKTHYFSN
jgi:hypothetical protein